MPRALSIPIPALILAMTLAGVSAGATLLGECDSMDGGGAVLTDAAGAIPAGETAAPVPDRQEVARLMAAAKEGDSAAQVTLGDLYERGAGVPQSMISASALYRRAAHQGNLEGLRRAWALRRMDLPLFERAEYGSAEAQYRIGHRYLEGQGAFLRDRGLARQWLSMAARLGHEGARADLARLDGENPRPAGRDR